MTIKIITISNNKAMISNNGETLHLVKKDNFWKDKFDNKYEILNGSEISLKDEKVNISERNTAERIAIKKTFDEKRKLINTNKAIAVSLKK